VERLFDNTCVYAWHCMIPGKSDVVLNIARTCSQATVSSIRIIVVTRIQCLWPTSQYTHYTILLSIWNCLCIYHIRRKCNKAHFTENV